MKKIDIFPGKENLFYGEVGKHPIFVKFYMDGCPHCENMKQDWIELENELLKNYDGDLTIMSVNARTLNNLKSPLISSIRGFPTIFMINKNGSKGLEFEGDRTKDMMLQFLLSNSDIKQKQSNLSKHLYINNQPSSTYMKVVKQTLSKQRVKRNNKRSSKKMKKTKTKKAKRKINKNKKSKK